MAAIWNNIKFEWDDETIEVRPTLNFINKIEQKQGSSLSLLLPRMQNGDLPMGVSCHVLGTTLREANIAITDEEIFERIMELGPKLGTLVGTIIAGCIPMPKDVKPGKSKAQ